VGKKKKKKLPPRRLRMNREGRMSSAKKWLAEYAGNNVVRGYKNHYGLSFECAIAELRMLGVKLVEKYIEKVLESEAARIRHRQMRKLEREQAEAVSYVDTDEHTAFIVGFTDEEVQFGITWEDDRHGQSECSH
jgi:hypothetical protein